METYERQQSASPDGNDHLYNVLWGLAAEEGAFLCECSDSCAVKVQLTPSEYAGLRDKGEILYAPGHNGAIA